MIGLLVIAAAHVLRIRRRSSSERLDTRVRAERRDQDIQEWQMNRRSYEVAWDNAEAQGHRERLGLHRGSERSFAEPCPHGDDDGVGQGQWSCPSQS